MTDTETDRVAAVRRTGFGLVAGGIIFAALSTVAPGVLLAGVLLAAAVVIRFEQPPGAGVINLSAALAILGVLLFLNGALDIGPFGPAAVAGFLVVGGAFDIIAARRLAPYVD